MEQKQTAVEWLVEQICGDHTSEWQEQIDQAKAMEKEQIVEAYDAGLFDGTMDDVNDRMHKQYYNETYGSKD
jgi:hypothetical protein